ncbi:iron-containing alcohol dehydrogenase [Fundicoccus sp. Sow4_F4]|uniref:iron-containing alcohol dehydrogenase n=1 Tax=Fundicoccus sp. Sow4_F4 TaxID=3438783 RepID=UPI003F92F02F
MNNFVYDIPTKVFFGEGQIKQLPMLVNQFGKKVLLVYGGGSIKRSGLYDEILELLPECEIFELSGIEPNPRIESIREGGELCKLQEIDLVLAVGGGSVLDAAKSIAAAAKYEGDPWEFVLDRRLITDALPLITVLTLSATGSEMNFHAVITNFETKEKLGTGNYHTYPYASILDPTYTYSVPRNQTAAGTADIMSHTFENYFSSTQDAYLQDRLAEDILKLCIHYLPIALEEPENYEARANLMWAATTALNGMISVGKGGAWSCHPMEHILSAYYDITHAVGLAILTPRWMGYVLNDDTVDRFATYAHNVWQIPFIEDKFAMAREAIDKTYQFFADSGLPMTLPEVGIDETHLEEMAEKVAPLLTQSYVPLNAGDVLAIYQACLTPGFTL